MNNLLKKRGGYDELYTPRNAILPILKYLKPNSRVWCPFDTSSSEYVKVLEEAGHSVYATHINKGIDFFHVGLDTIGKDNFTSNLNIDYIISNPPFSIKDKILERLYKIGIPFMILLPLSTLEGVKRNKLFKQHGIEILVLNKRINFLGEHGKKSPYFNTSYFCWKVLDKSLEFTEVE